MAQTRNFTGNVNDTTVVGIVVVPECDRREPLKRLDISGNSQSVTNTTF
ncbi:MULTISPECIES: hypothetical protein [Cylindrospermopsis]|uniref:Uncharacterized protein n=2 Tax=Cylindrospermopsis TaxID=77021 RepID=A0A7H0EY52_9CYAN|nr:MULTISPECIES: hypothetical protein [Cylindrospermopsis]MBU6346586.1 hypothetical protein [Cyanobacteria bacterium REEB494]MBA4445235.1 hypothetical protein [Cylindrospermopsis raciborskii CS-506_C]MBA4449457.1 hypothetical protein [Cylindrospermopsis raciborskii CS-506_D]MBA4456101.1 hypothetical protein [Cylindrospermopsis raciborskii CS-506_B]MBA4465438.1 hypothetical protein [Cylindrospermopsis raciborskii CS-506_A]